MTTADEQVRDLCGTPECPCGDVTLCGCADPDELALEVQNYRDRIDGFVRGRSEGEA